MKRLSCRKNILYCSTFFSLAINRELVALANERGWVLNSMLWNWEYETLYTGGLSYDGVISHLTTSGTQALMEHLGEPLPHVTLHPVTAIQLPMPGVVLDHIAAGRLAGQHFLQLGFGHFAAIINRAPHETFLRRTEGVSQVLREAGMPPLRMLHLPGARSMDLQAEHDAYRAFLAEMPKPLAVIPVNDHLANVLVNVCRESELSVPAQISICGFDNDTIACELAPVPLSSVDTAQARQAREAGEVLGRMIKGEDVSDETRLIPPEGLKVRRTSGLPAQASVTMAEALAYMHESFQNPDLTIPDVSAAIGVSRRTLSSTFRREMDTSPLKYLIRLRVRKAIGLIRETGRKIKEIRADCGFSSDYQMYMAFKRCTGKGPARFRHK